jgi:VIT1/CCC1 family predicted Fe2+/Mn2+ transporter
MLESGSINIYKSSATLTDNVTTTSAAYIDELVKKAVEKHSASILDIEVMLTNSIGNVHTEIEALEKRLGLSEKLAANQAEEIEQLKKAISDRVSEISSSLIANPLDKLPPIDNADEDTLEPQETENSLVDLSKLQGAHTLTWVAFLSAIGMEIERDKDRKLVQNVKLAKIAIDKAMELGSPGWEYISLNRRFIQV